MYIYTRGFNIMCSVRQRALRMRTDHCFFFLFSCFLEICECVCVSVIIQYVSHTTRENTVFFLYRLFYHRLLIEKTIQTRINLLNWHRKVPQFSFLNLRPWQTALFCLFLVCTSITIAHTFHGHVINMFVFVCTRVCLSVSLSRSVKRRTNP